ncbi:MAG: hypothetical protein ACKVPY_05340 [Paracoccaceae bacterium]
MKTQIAETGLTVALPPLGPFRLAAAISRWLARRRVVRELRLTARARDGLDDAILRDIGLKRGSIEAALREQARLRR